MSTYAVTRTETIGVTPDRIAPLITRFPAWQQWSPFERSDPELRRSYRGPAEGAGSEYEWSGNAKAGAGVMTMTAATSHRVDIQVRFRKPFKAVSEHVFTLEPAGDSTEVTWTMTGDQTGVTGLLMRLMMPMERAMGPEFERGLTALKALAETVRDQAVSPGRPGRHGTDHAMRTSPEDASRRSGSTSSGRT